MFSIDGSEESATLVESIRDELIVHANDVVFVGADEFYFTRWEYYPYPSLASLFELLTFRAWCYVARCVRTASGWQCTRVLEDQPQPNGITFSHDHTRAFIAYPLHQEIVEFRRDTATGALSEVRRTKTTGGVDNFFMTKDGRLLGTSHLNHLDLDFIRHSKAAEHKSPCAVLEFADNGAESIKLVTSRISAGSVAIEYDNALYIGAVFDEGLLKCPIS